MRKFNIQIVFLIVCLINDSIQQQPVCKDCNVNGQAGTFVGPSGNSGPVQAFPNPDGTFTINGQIYGYVGGGSAPRFGAQRPTYTNPVNPAASGPGCVCSGGVCSNCAVG